jgi:L-rhamnose-H+ transport protein
MQDAIVGLVLLVVAGVMNASFTLPMKFTKKWAWENTWTVWTVIGLLILPPLTAYLTIPNLGAVYARAGTQSIVLVALCGLAWGVAQVLFGLAVNAIGIALGFAIVLGLSAALGSLIPLIRLHPEKIFTAAGLTAIGGVVLVIVGVSVCAIAGRKRERALGTVEEHKMSFSAGLACAIVSGICAAAMNFGVAFGGALSGAAEAEGATRVWSINAVWLPLMVAGAIPSFFYCPYLMRKNKTSSNFSAPGTGSYWLLAALMAVLWFTSTIMYGAASGKLGELGAVLGWPLFMSLIVITASILGIATGEWKNTGKGPLRIQMTGAAILVLAVIVLSRAGM